MALICDLTAINDCAIKNKLTIRKPYDDRDSQTASNCSTRLCLANRDQTQRCCCEGTTAPVTSRALWHRTHVTTRSPSAPTGRIFGHCSARGSLPSWREELQPPAALKSLGVPTRALSTSAGTLLLQQLPESLDPHAAPGRWRRRPLCPISVTSVPLLSPPLSPLSPQPAQHRPRMAKG